MPEDVQTCPLCRGHKFNRFDRRFFRGYEVINQICENCGLVFQSPQMTEMELDDFYSGQYRTIYQGQEEPEVKDLAVQRLRADWLVDFFGQYSTEPSRYLDIGSSSGILLETFQSAFDCTVKGIEPGDSYREFAKKRGLNIYKSLRELEKAEEECFDLISLIHVLEHIQDPVSYLGRLRENHLSAKGKLLIEVPNLFVHDCFEIAHLFSFTKHTLREVLIQAGFEVIKVATHGHPRSLSLNLYITVLAEPAEDYPSYQVKPEHGVGIKRKLGMLSRRVIQKIFPDRAWIAINQIIEK